MSKKIIFAWEILKYSPVVKGLTKPTKVLTKGL